MNEPTLSALIGWNRAELKRWHGWFTLHPSALEVSMGSGAGSVRKAIFHTLVVDLRYAQRLVGLSVSSYEHIEASNIDSLFALAERANGLLNDWLSHATSADLERIHTFITLSAGERTASARKIVVHACTHHVRHWAQIATVLRMSGLKSDWPHDLLFSDAMR